MHKLQVKDLLYIQKGRINRQDFFFLSFLINQILKLSDYDTGYEILNYAILAPAIFFSYISCSLIAKRFRDISLSGWWALPYMIIIIGLVIMVENFSISDQPLILWSSLAGIFICGLALTFWPRTKHDNKYGPYVEKGIFG